MAKKIGEILIARGKLTRRQLETALKAQLIYGGHLGTCLIELGMIDETTLGAVLSEVSNCPYAPPEALQEIPEKTIHCLTQRLAEEYRVIPMKVADRTLHLAMCEPQNLQALDELRFATGCRIIPWVAPELRIFQALEKYYGVPRRLRYIAICRALDELAANGMAASERTPAWRKSFDEALRSAGESEPERGSVPASPVGGAPQELSDASSEFGYGRSWLEVAEELHLDAPQAVPTAAPKGESSLARLRKSTVSGPGLPEVAEMLCGADSKEAAANAVMAYLGSRLPRALLLGVHGDTASLWTARGVSMDPSKKARFPVTGDGVFDLLLGNDFYRGPLPVDERYRTFYRAFGMEPPSEVLLVPVYLSDRLLAVFHGDAGPSGPIQGETDEYLRLFRLFGLSLNLLILKTKIRDAARTPASVPRVPVATGPVGR